MSIAALGWPRTLAGRVLLIILGGLLVAHLASFAFYEIERERAIDRYSANDIASRIVEYARSPQAAAAPQRGGPMRPRLRWVEVEALGRPPADSQMPSGVFNAELRHQLAEALGEDPVAWLTMREPQRLARQETLVTGPRPPGPGYDRNMKTITVALKLPGGKHVLAEALAFQPSLQIPTEAWVSIALIFVVTALFSIWAVRLAVQPVRMLADAAERLSRNIDEPPLPEEGATEIRGAARAFNRMQDRLRRHVNTRALAFAAMSHDIRTPLTRMRLRLESFGDDVRQKLERDVREIELLSKSVLEVTRGLAPEESMVSVDVETLVGQLVADYDAMGQRIDTSGQAARVEARPLALRRALANLLDNAFKYGKDVKVDIRDCAENVAIRVCDNGPGIPPEYLEKVVVPFYRVESSRNRDTGGAGLGLAIAKDIVEGHGGELLLENLREGGFCATVKLPR